jgi:hypothetical protein
VTFAGRGVVAVLAAGLAEAAVLLAAGLDGAASAAVETLAVVAGLESVAVDPALFASVVNGADAAAGAALLVAVEAVAGAPLLVSPPVGTELLEAEATTGAAAAAAVPDTPVVLGVLG